MGRLDYHPKARYMSINAFARKYGVSFTVNHTGKMEGMISLSTSPIRNTYCQKRSKCENTICHHCYALNMALMFGSLADRLSKNYDVLTKTLIPVEEWPVLNARYVRLESFGDLQTVTQFKNYVNLCKRNPASSFALWTKNYAIVRKAVESGTEKPKNLIVIVSSPLVNVESDLSAYPLADKTFTVYATSYAREHGVAINCGGRACLTCGRCYRKRGNAEVRELLK